MDKIVHITVDEKFINSAYEQFLNLGFENEFYIFAKSKDFDFKYVKQRSSIYKLSTSKKSLMNFARNLNDCLVIFHGLSFPACIIASQIKKRQNIKLVWFMWGAEFYFNRLIFPKGKYTHLGPMSLIIDKTIDKQKRSQLIISKLKTILIECLYNTTNRSKLVYTTMKDFDYIATPYIEEKQLIESMLIKKSNYIKFSYYPLELIVDDLEKVVCGNNILIGNSASSTNNHLEVFEILQKLSIDDRKIFCPLSYGDKEYGKMVSDIGKSIFNQNFNALTSFLPLNEYNDITSSCGIVIMNHYRQQAFGNIIAMLYVGAKVYLNEKSTVYTFLVNLGIYIFSIQKDLKIENIHVFENLDKEKMIHNRGIIKDYMSKDRLHESLKKDIEDLMKS